jgi:ADP-ribose pyrophosphatase
MANKIKKWKELSRKVVFQKYGRKIEKVIFELPDGIKEEFYIKNEGVGVNTLALTPDNKIILFKLFRPGPNEIIYEIPGGIVEKNEMPKKAAERELLEETGFRGEVHFVVKVYKCSYSSMTKNCYAVVNCKKIREPKVNHIEKFAEIIFVSVGEFKEILKTGRLTDIDVGYLCLDYLHLL